MMLVRSSKGLQAGYAANSQPPAHSLPGREAALTQRKWNEGSNAVFHDG